MNSALRRRMLCAFLKQSGVREPEARHIAQAENLVFADRPSAFSQFPGGVILRRSYDRFVADGPRQLLEETVLPVGEQILVEDLLIEARAGDCLPENCEGFAVYPQGEIMVRCRRIGDAMRLPGGTKTLKKLMIDRKIPAALRDHIPVIADEAGVLGVYGIGANLDRTQGAGEPITVLFMKSIPNANPEDI